MQVDNVDSAVFSIVARKVSLPKDMKVERSTLIADMGMESLDAVEIFFEIEDQFGVTIENTDFPITVETTIGDLIDLVRAKQEKVST